MKRHCVAQIVLVLSLTPQLFSCAGSAFQVKSDPVDAEVFVENPKTGARKLIGKTPLEMPNAALKEAVGDELPAGEFFTVVVEKKGFISERTSVPATRFGTLMTNLDVKMKAGEDAKQIQVASEILDHLYIAQKLALKKEYERAQIELDKIIADHPTFARALSMRGGIYYMQGKFADSTKWYEEALKADPKMEEAIRMLAKAKQGRAPASQGGAKK